MNICKSAARAVSLLALCGGAALAQAPAAPSPSTPAAQPPTSETVYVVKPGDTLLSIAKDQLAAGGKDYRRLAAHNGLRDANVLAPGTNLRIPTDWLRRQASTARVIALAGDVRVGERSLQVGDRVAEGEQVASGANSHATLEFGDRSILRIRPGTRVTVEAHRVAPSLQEFETRLRLGAGAIEAAVTRQRSQDFRVRTPTANMAVRGTEFRVRGDEKGTQAEVMEGRVGVAGAKGKELLVGAGFGTVVLPGQEPGGLVRLLPAPDLSRVATLQERPIVRIAFPEVDGAQGYRFVAAEDADFTRLVAFGELRGPVVRLVDLQDGEYFFAVRGLGPAGFEGAEARNRFRLKARPVPPSIQAPLGDSIVFPGPVPFLWDRSEEAGSYRFQLASDEKFSALVVDRPGLAEPYIEAEIPAPGRYYWRIAVVRPSGDQGPFGDAESIQVRPRTAP